MSFNENGSHNRTESERVFFQIIEDLEENFKWIDLSEVKDNSLCAGLPIVLLDVYISNQILQMISESYNHETELQSFFSYVENVLCGSDSLMIECFQTTLIEKIASRSLR